MLTVALFIAVQNESNQDVLQLMKRYIKWSTSRQWRVIQREKEISYRAMQGHMGNFKCISLTKRSYLRRLHIIWFQLLDMLEKKLKRSVGWKGVRVGRQKNPGVSYPGIPLTALVELRDPARSHCLCGERSWQQRFRPDAAVFWETFHAPRTFLEFNHFNRYVEISHFCFNLQFPNDKGCWTYFHIFICHL